MLKSLQVKNYVLIDSLEIDFPAGLVIITGQTGAGKTLLLGSVALLSGAKADASVVGPSGDNCVVEGEFQCGGDVTLKALFEENDLPWDNGNIIIRRVVSNSGRSRCFIGDEPVSKEVLQEISSRLVDIHSQHQTLKLSDPSFRMEVLDSFAGASPLRIECGALWRDLQAKNRALAEVEAEIVETEKEREFNSLMFEQLNSARLREGEMEELEAEQKILSNAEEIKLSLLKVTDLLGGEVMGQNVSSVLKEASKTLLRLNDFVPAAGELSERLDSARAEIDDILSEAESLEESTEVSGDRLQAVEERLSQLYSLMSKHSVSTIEQLIQKRDTLSDALNGGEALKEKREELLSAISKARTQYESACNSLHQKRESARDAFSEEVSASLQALSLEGARFRAELEPVAPGPSGTDAVNFLFSAKGVREGDAGKIASGGELSRIMLSIKALMARFTDLPTAIFDEIDTGVSGSVADNVGSMISRMGEDMQVFAITHLPQVAVKGSTHLLVTKEESAQGRTVTHIKKLSAEERVNEIARLLSGSEITPQARANAEILLRNSQNRK